MITLKDYVTASGKYPNRDNSPELTELVVQNAVNLIIQINRLLKDLGVKDVKVSSGFRPSAANQAAGGAKKSLHQRGLACDILDDKNQTLYKLIAAKPDLLLKHGLWMEHGDFTKGKWTNWVHLDMGTRSERPVRIFKP